MIVRVRSLSKRGEKGGKLKKTNAKQSSSSRLKIDFSPSLTSCSFTPWNFTPICCRFFHTCSGFTNESIDSTLLRWRLTKSTQKHSRTEIAQSSRQQRQLILHTSGIFHYLSNLNAERKWKLCTLLFFHTRRRRQQDERLIASKRESARKTFHQFNFHNETKQTLRSVCSFFFGEKNLNKHYIFLTKVER